MLFKALLFRLFELCWFKGKKTRPNPKTLLIVKVDGIGDYVLCRNFIAALKSSEKFQDYTITLCGNQVIKDLVDTLDASWIDHFIGVHPHSLVHRLSYRKKLFNQIRGLGFSTVIQPTYSRDYFAGDSLVKASGAPERIGSSGNTSNTPGWLKKWGDSLYTQLLPAQSDPMFEFDRNKEFFEQLLGIPINLSRAHIALGDKTFSIPSPYIVLFPGAGQNTRRWPLDSFTTAGAHLHTKTGLPVVIAGDPSTLKNVKHPRFQTVITHSLTDLTALLNGCALLLCNDTGAAHLGAALNKPVVCISNGSSAIRFHPYPPHVSHFKVVYPPLDLIKKQKVWRIKAISVEQVSQAALGLLNDHRVGSSPSA